MSAVLVLLASCSQGDDLSPAGGTADGLVPVTLSVAVAEDGAATRATTAGEDELPTRGFVQIFTTEDNGQTIVPAGGDLAGVKPMTSNGGGSFSLSGIYLNPNDTYVFLYWADNAASTAPAPDDMNGVTYTAGIDDNWGNGGTIQFTPHNINEGNVTIDGGQHYITGDGTETQNTITITGDAIVYLENVNINSTDGSAISITGGNPTIHVRGKNTVTSSSSLNLADGSAGIYVAQGSSVTITGNDRNNDVLWAQTSINGAGIGGRGRFSEAQCGNITIEKVTVYAYACIPRDMEFPGIGGYMDSGTIKIKDATVHAYGSTDAIQFPPTAIGASNVPVIIIEKSDIYAHRGTKHDNRNADYIGRSATGIYSGTEEIQYGTGGSITNTTVYCYTGSSDTVDKTYWFDASGSRTEQ